MPHYRLAPRILGALAFAMPSPAAAHAFGARYDLPIPLPLYLLGAGAAVQLSLVVSAVFLRNVEAAHARYIYDLRAFKDHRAALLSQIPMVVLMVGYTMISLWILSQPIVEGG